MKKRSRAGGNPIKRRRRKAAGPKSGKVPKVAARGRNLPSFSRGDRDHDQGGRQRGRLWRRRQLSITFVLVPDKLLDEPFWIRESNQMTTPNYVDIGFQA
jgi:hypothetical protein